MKTWHHPEHNVRIKLDEHLTLHKWGEDFFRLKLPKDKSNHRFYPTFKAKRGRATKIRRVVNGELTPLQASSEYELMRTLPKETIDGQITISNYVVKQPSLMVFDQMPAAHYLDIDEKGHAKDFNYKNKHYHPGDVPIKSLDRVPVVRIHSPYSISANPYYMDEGLHNIDIQYGHNDNAGLQEAWLRAVTDIAQKHDFEVRRNGGKLLYRHRNRWVKFESSEMARGVLACYINIDSAYNKAYDFYRPDIPKDVRNIYAYGLKRHKAHITHNFVDEVIARFAEILNLPIEDRPYEGEELTKWQLLEKLHADQAWIKDGIRKDASWFYQEPLDGFEHEFDLAEKPASNVFKFGLEHSGLDFHYQPPLTEEEIANGHQRMPHVEGSYAIYHPTKKHNDYQAGKVAHIYRPIATDAAGLSYFCGLKIENDVLSITVPQEFLDSATYPVTVDPTIGYATAGASSLALPNVQSPNGAWAAEQNNVGMTGKITAFNAYYSVAVSSNTAKVILGMYQNSNGSRVDYSAEKSYSANLSAQWNSFTSVVGPNIDTRGYDLTLFAQMSTNAAYTMVTIYYDTSSFGNVGATNNSTTYSSPPPSTEPTKSSTSTAIYSFYATYTSFAGNFFHFFN